MKRSQVLLRLYVLAALLPCLWLAGPGQRLVEPPLWAAASAEEATPTQPDRPAGLGQARGYRVEIQTSRFWKLADLAAEIKNQAGSEIIVDERLESEGVFVAQGTYYAEELRQRVGQALGLSTRRPAGRDRRSRMWRLSWRWGRPQPPGPPGVGNP